MDMTIERTKLLERALALVDEQDEIKKAMSSVKIHKFQVPKFDSSHA